MPWRPLCDTTYRQLSCGRQGLNTTCMHLRGNVAGCGRLSCRARLRQQVDTAYSVLERKMRVLIQFAHARPRAGTSSRPPDISCRPPVCLQAGALLLMSVSAKASITCADIQQRLTKQSQARTHRSRHDVKDGKLSTLHQLYIRLECTCMLVDVAHSRSVPDW